MLPILARSAENRFGFWGSAPDPAGGLRRSLRPPSRNLTYPHVLIYRHPSFLISMFPSRLPLLNSWIRPPVHEVCGFDELWIFLYALSPPNLCIEALCYFMNPASH